MLCFIFTCSPILNVSSLTFVVQAMVFQAKLPSHYVLKSYSMVMTFFKLFQA